MWCFWVSTLTLILERYLSWNNADRLSKLFLFKDHGQYIGSSPKIELNEVVIITMRLILS
jgi:hypothetical protein